MTPDECENYRQRLLDLAARLRKDDVGMVNEALRQTGGDGSNLSHVPMHLADLGADASEQDMSASLLTNGREMQREVAAAMDRLEQGTFGKCLQCGQDVGKGRLDALPYTRDRVACAQNAVDDGEVGFQPTLL